MAHLSQDKLLSLLENRIKSFDIHDDDYSEKKDSNPPHNDTELLGLDFLGRNVYGECIHPNPLASHKIDLFDKERLLTGIDLPEILDIVKKWISGTPLNPCNAHIPFGILRAIYHSTLCPFMVNLLQERLKNACRTIYPLDGLHSDIQK